MLPQSGLSVLLSGGLSEHVLHGIVPADATQLSGILSTLEEASEEVQHSCCEYDRGVMMIMIMMLMMMKMMMMEVMMSMSMMMMKMMMMMSTMMMMMMEVMMLMSMMMMMSHYL